MWKFRSFTLQPDCLPRAGFDCCSAGRTVTTLLLQDCNIVHKTSIVVSYYQLSNRDFVFLVFCCRSGSADCHQLFGLQTVPRPGPAPAPLPGVHTGGAGQPSSPPRPARPTKPLGRHQAGPRSARPPRPRPALHAPGTRHTITTTLYT